MADEKYKIPEAPGYWIEDIRKLQDGDLASATGTFNPLIQKVLESIAHVNQHKAGLSEDGKVPLDQLPEMGKGQPGGFASLDETGKVPASQLPEMDYIPTGQIGVPGGVAPMDEDGKIPDEYINVQGGLVAQDEPPENTKLGWIDTANGNILKFYRVAEGGSPGEWIPTGSVWG